MFEVTFQPPTSVPLAQALSDQMKVRVKGFTAPVPIQKTYDVNWKTVSVKRPATKLDLDRTIEFTFRLDAYYDIYTKLLTWQSLTSVGAAGYATSDLTNKTGSIEVKALASPILSMDSVGIDPDKPISGETEEVLKWVFEDAWIESLTLSAFNADDAEPVEVTAKFNFGKYSDPAATPAGL
jgi:hypothetical protein